MKKHVIGLMLLFVIFSMTFADDLAKNDYLTISPSISYYYAVTPEYLFLISTEENYCEECPRDYFRLDNDGWFYFFYKGDKWDDTCITTILPDAYSSDWEDKSVPFVQTYTYKCDKKEILDRIEAAKKACEAND